MTVKSKAVAISFMQYGGLIVPFCYLLQNKNRALNDGNYNNHASNNTNDVPISKQQEKLNYLKQSLKKKLKVVRENMTYSPPVTITTDDLKDRVELSFTCEDNCALALDILLNGITKHNGEMIYEPLENNEKKHVKENELSLTQKDGSIKVKFGHCVKMGKDSIVLSKKEPFLDSELDYFIESYTEGGSIDFKKEKSRSREQPSILFPSELDNDSFFGKHRGRLFFPHGDEADVTTGGGKNHHLDTNNNTTNKKESILQRLSTLGVIIYKDNETKENKLDWNFLAGNDLIKKKVEDTILLGLAHPKAFDIVTKKTRTINESNKPRAILFEGPPGVGKTLTARIIGSEANVPLIYIPIETIMSKFYGESEGRLAEILKLCDQLECGAIVFLDEIDSLASSRDSDTGGGMHEATRRILSVLLRTLDGFVEKKDNSSLLIAATNRKEDLDKALISRFDVSIPFGLPSNEARAKIFKHYARQLSLKQIEELASKSQGLSPRNIKDICKYTERKWVSHCLRNNDDESNNIDEEISAPPFDFYINALKELQK